MSLVLQSSVSAIGANGQTSFAGQGGVEPYVYSVVGGGAGGTINASTGLYTAPVVVDPDPRKTFDTVKVVDDDGAEATAQIAVFTPLGLFADIIQKELGLANGRVYFWDQKINSPTDAGLFIAISIQSCKPFGNTNKFVDGDSVQSVNMLAKLGIDITSRDMSAVHRKEEVIMALASSYAESQMEANSFSIGTLPAGSEFTNLSGIDGAAIPYRFNISVNMQYFVRKIKGVPYFDDFAAPEVTTES